MTISGLNCWSVFAALHVLFCSTVEFVCMVCLTKPAVTRFSNAFKIIALSFIHSFNQSINHSFIHSFICSFIHSFIHSATKNVISRVASLRFALPGAVTDGVTFLPKKVMTFHSHRPTHYPHHLHHLHLCSVFFLNSAAKIFTFLLGRHPPGWCQPGRSPFFPLVTTLSK